MSRLLRDLLLAALSGLLLLLSFPYPDLGFLAFVALIPLLYGLYRNSVADGFLLGLVTGGVFFAGISYWFLIYGALPFVGIVSATALIIGVFGAGSSFVARRSGPWLRLLFIPAWWVALEVLRSELGSWSYPYGVLGYALHGSLPVIQIASLLGVYGISFLIVMVNVALAETPIGHSERAPTARSKSGRPKNLIGHMRSFASLRMTGPRVFVAGLLLAALAFGVVRLNAGEPTGPSLDVALIQVSTPESLDLAPDAAKEMAAYERALARAASDRPDLVVTPESTLPMYVRQNDFYYGELKRWARALGKPLLAGVPYIASDGRAFNSAQLFDASGRVFDTYAKLYPVPFGEFVPFRPVTERLYGKTAMLGDITPGNRLTVFDLRETGDGRREEAAPRPPSLRTPNSEPRTFSVLLCSESSYSQLARRLVARGANMLFVLTNDAWFLKSPEAEQHFNMSKFRAVENGRYLVQAANSGISGFVTPTGRVLKKSKLFQVATLKGKVSFEGGKTVYTRIGYIFPYATVLLSLILLATSAFREPSPNLWIRRTVPNAVDNENRPQTTSCHSEGAE